MNFLKKLFKRAWIGRVNVDSLPEVTIQSWKVVNGEHVVVHNPGEADYFQLNAPLFNTYELVWVADFSLYEHAFVFAQILSEKLEVPVKNLVGSASL